MNATAVVYFTRLPPSTLMPDGNYCAIGPIHHVERSRHTVKIMCNADFQRYYDRWTRIKFWEEVKFEVSEDEFKANRGFVVPGDGAYVFRRHVIVVPSTEEK